MANKNKLREILGALNAANPDVAQASADFSNALSGIAQQFNKQLSTNATTLEEARSKYKSLSSLIASIQQGLADFKDKVSATEEELGKQLDAKFAELKELDDHYRSLNKKRYDEIVSEIATIQKQLDEVSQRKIEFPDYQTPLDDLEKRLNAAIRKVEKSIPEIPEDDDSALQAQIDELQKTYLEVKDRLNQLAQRGGGSINRQIYIGGADALSKYSDINLKAGSNVTLSYANNNTTKQVDITITSAGGSGSTRSINSISTDTSAGATGGTDYVYLCTGTLTLTLPTAVGNTNLYTVKNVGTGVITVATTSAQTIDGNSSITMATQFTAVDLISDSQNWAIT